MFQLTNLLCSPKGSPKAALEMSQTRPVADSGICRPDLLKGQKSKTGDSCDFFSAALLPCPHRTGQRLWYPSPHPRLPGTGVSHPSGTCSPLRIKYLWAPSPSVNNRGIASSVSFPSLKCKQEGSKSSSACLRCRWWYSLGTCMPVLLGAAHGGCLVLSGSPRHSDHRTCLQTTDKRSSLFFRVSCCLRFLFAF